MTLSFHQFNNAMTVMDGDRIVAVARNRASNGWVLELNGASWLDHRARKPSKVTRTVNPSILVVPHRTEAAILMIKLTNTGRNPD